MHYYHKDIQKICRMHYYYEDVLAHNQTNFNRLPLQINMENAGLWTSKQEYILSTLVAQRNIHTQSTYFVCVLKWNSANLIRYKNIGQFKFLIQQTCAVTMQPGKSLSKHKHTFKHIGKQDHI